MVTSIFIFITFITQVYIYYITDKLYCFYSQPSGILFLSNKPNICYMDSALCT